MIDHELSPSIFLVIQAALVVAVAASGTGAALYTRKQTTDGRSILGGAATILAVAATFTAVGIAAGVGPFGVIRLAYLAGVVALPLASAGILVARVIGQTTMSSLGLTLAGMGLLAAPLGAYVSWVEPNRLALEQSALVVSRDRAGRNAIRLGVLADLQADSIGEHERAAVDLLMAQHPDIILIPGDLFQGTGAQWNASRAALGELLRRLDAPGGVFFVMGDVDTGHTLELLSETRIRTLRNEIVNVRLGDREITIGGVDRSGGDVIRALETMPGAGDIRILLAHRPDHVLSLGARTRVDLTVAGHTHGGQIIIPGFGPIMTLSAVPRNVAAGGLHWLGSRAIYVSRGVGMERLEAPPMRFNCVPEVSILTLAQSP
ncbi:MAG TPA: metallophosphoesterase [Terriglobia bacterium]|nr:metallophosphoesterase [Terriglobia bacterium]